MVTPFPSRTGLKPWQIQGLERVLRQKKWGCLIDTRVGHSYGRYEVVAVAGERMMTILTAHFNKGDRPIHFTLVGHRCPNAYAIWMKTFETISLTSRMAQDIDALADAIATHLVDERPAGSGFAYVAAVELSRIDKIVTLKKLLVEGAVAFLVGHEAGHLAAGHQPIIRAGGAGGDHARTHRRQNGVLLDQFAAACASSSEPRATKSALRLNAHEVDADVQGVALAGVFWTRMKQTLHESGGATQVDDFLRTATATPERLLLLASAGAAVALAQFAFAKFDVGWNQQRTHPLTAVRFAIALGALGRFVVNPDAGSSLELTPECVEVVEMLHQVLARLLIRAADFERTASPFENQLRAASINERTLLMLNATGLGSILADPQLIAGFLTELRDEFDACAELRQPYLRVNERTLLPWGRFVAELGAPAAESVP